MQVVERRVVLQHITFKISSNITLVRAPLSPTYSVPHMHLNYRIFRPITRALSIQKGSEIVKNEHARYTLERFPTDNARVICTKIVSENTVLCIKHNFQLKLVCSIHSVALLSQGTVLQLTTDH